MKTIMAVGTLPNYWFGLPVKDPYSCVGGFAFRLWFGLPVKDHTDVYEILHFVFDMSLL